jgi:hypothetical protein
MITFWETPAAYILGMGGISGTLMRYEKKRTHWAELKMLVIKPNRNQK